MKKTLLELTMAYEKFVRQFQIKQKKKKKKLKILDIKTSERPKYIKE